MYSHPTERKRGASSRLGKSFKTGKFVKEGLRPGAGSTTPRRRFQAISQDLCLADLKARNLYWRVVDVERMRASSERSGCTCLSLTSGLETHISVRSDSFPIHYQHYCALRFTTSYFVSGKHMRYRLSRISGPHNCGTNRFDSSNRFDYKAV